MQKSTRYKQFQFIEYNMFQRCGATCGKGSQCCNSIRTTTMALEQTKLTGVKDAKQIKLTGAKDATKTEKNCVKKDDDIKKVNFIKISRK